MPSASEQEGNQGMPNQVDLDKALAALRADRDLTKLSVCPGPRGKDGVRHGLRVRGRHLNWYIGEFQHRPGISGPVRCDEAPTFKTEGAAKEFLERVRAIW